MANSGTPDAASTDANASELQQLIARSYMAIKSNFYNGHLKEELNALLRSMQQERLQGRPINKHSSQLTEALDLKCSAGFNRLGLLDMPLNCTSLELHATAESKQL